MTSFIKSLDPPNWATRFISKDEAQRCADAIVAAELKTSGEVIVAIAQKSAPVRHIAVSLSLFFICAGFLLQLSDLDLTGYLVEVAAIPVAVLLSRLSAVQRLLSIEADLEDAVNLMARSVFHAAGTERTSGATGVLIFISLMEHRVVVLGDQAIDTKLPHTLSDKSGHNIWKDVVQHVLQGIRKRSLAEGVIAAVGAAGELLSAHFPAEKHNPDEIPNHLVFIRNS